MSEIAAVAAETASDALIWTCGDLSASGVLSRGNSTSTSPIQNVKRSRKNILLLRQSFSSSAAFNPRGRSPASVDKSQVFALRLNREDFAKKSFRLIRRKFSIDADSMDSCEPVHHFETISTCAAETRRSPSALIGRRIRRLKRCGDTVFCRNSGRLSVRLMSL